MKHLAAVLIGFIVYFSSGTTLAAAPQDENTAAKVQAPKIQVIIEEKKSQRAESMEADPSNRASMLYILLVAGVMIVVVNIIISFAKKKMEEDIKVVQDESGAETQKDKS